jgi:hypothetical protein
MASRAPIELKANKLAPYTMRGGSFDAEIQLKLDEFVSVLASSRFRDSIVSLLLAGSCARGVASVTLRQGCAPEMVSDFDVYVITRRRLPRPMFREFIRELADQAARSRHRFRVDLHVLARGSLRRIPPVIRYLDLRRHGKLLAGEDVMGEIPAITAGDLPHYEGFRRMLNAVFFFFERAAAGESEADLLAYLYTEAASAFAIGAGVYGESPAAVLAALEGSCFGRLLRDASRASKISAAWAWKWDGERRGMVWLQDWETSLRDYVTMIDIYAECAWGCTLSQRNTSDRDDIDATALRIIAREAFPPYARWAIRQWTGIDSARDGIGARFAASVFQIFGNVPVLALGRNRGLPAGSSLAIHHGLKIYWTGRRLLEQVASRGRDFNDAPEGAAVAHFMQLFERYFFSDPRTRTVIQFQGQRLGD